MVEAGRLSPELQSALDSIDRAVEGMSDEQLTWHPEGKWSAAEILEHLSLAYSRTNDRLKLLIQTGQQPQVRARTTKEWIGGLVVLKLGRIPSGRKSPEMLLPKGMSPRSARSSIRDNLCLMDKTIDRCEQHFGGQQNVLLHPVLGPLSTREWRKFHRIHTVHHMRQIDALRERMKQAASVGQSRS